MKTKTLNLLALTLSLIVSALLTSCRTTEANYRAAYEKTIQGRSDADSLQQTFKQEHMMNRVATAQGDTIDISTKFIQRVLDDGSADSNGFNRYMVAVAQFKQLFNARSMCTRLKQSGYPDALLMLAADKYYYVMLDSYTSLPEAKAELDRIKADKKFPIAMRAPMPMIVESARHRR